MSTLLYLLYAISRSYLKYLDLTLEIVPILGDFCCTRALVFSQRSPLPGVLGKLFKLYAKTLEVLSGIFLIQLKIVGDLLGNCGH